MTVSSPTASTQRQQSFNSEGAEIWSTILTGVASSKMVPTKKLLILGDPSSGKSTLIHYLKNDPGPQIIQTENDQVQTASSNNNFGINNIYNNSILENNNANLDNQDATNTLALGYSFIDVQDEENEAIARLGVYQLGLSSVEYMPLLKFALSTDTLADSAIIIVLDWTRPWEFLSTLQRWINVVQHRIDEICKEGTVGESWSRGKAVVDELREKVEHYLQTYTEPVPVNTFNMTASTSTGSLPSNMTTATTTTNTTATNTTFATTPLVTTTTSADQVTLPLTQGSLTNNLGISITVVCCKSDAQNTLEQTLDYKDEQFDFIQQTLRCICMKYGATLFYTSTLQPYTFHNLRQYILHRLLATSSKSYPFKLKAQVVERDAVLVPSGWDSWGKLRVLREGFDCEAVSQGWESDMDAIEDRQQPGVHGARGNYEQAIVNPNSTEQPLTNIPPPVTCEDEQLFLERHFETLQDITDRPNRKGTGAASTRPSVVGPLGFSSPSSAIDLVRDTDRLLSSSSRLSDSSAKLASANPSSSDHYTMGASSLPPAIDTTTHSSRTTSTATNANPTSATTSAGGGPSHEVLASFFQSLLSKKTSSTGGSSPTANLLNNNGSGDIEDGSGSTTGTNNSTALHVNGIDTDTPPSQQARRPTVSRKDVHKELDKMRQYTNKQ